MALLIHRFSNLWIIYQKWCEEEEKKANHEVETTEGATPTAPVPIGSTPAEDATPVDVADAAEGGDGFRAEGSAAVVGEEPEGDHAWKTRSEERRAEKAEEVPDSAGAVVRPDEGDVVARRAAEDERMKDEAEDRELRRRTIRECRRPALVRADEEKEEYRAEESAAVGEEPAEGDDAKYGQDAAVAEQDSPEQIMVVDEGPDIMEGVVDEEEGATNQEQQVVSFEEEATPGRTQQFEEKAETIAKHEAELAVNVESDQQPLQGREKTWERQQEDKRKQLDEELEAKETAPQEQLAQERTESQEKGNAEKAKAAAKTAEQETNERYGGNISMVVDKVPDIMKRVLDEEEGAANLATETSFQERDAGSGGGGGNIF